LECDKSVLSYVCDRERAIVWGIKGGLPSMPHGLHLVRKGQEREDWIGSIFSDEPIFTGDVFSRPTAGEGGYGDPLERDPEAVLEDVIDEWVLVERTAKDCGVVISPVDPEICEYEIDMAATEAARAEIRTARAGWFAAESESIAQEYRNGIVDKYDAVRRHAVILDWDTGELLPKSTAQFREMFKVRTVDGWT
jgi:N-methylhydantoinase B